MSRHTNCVYRAATVSQADLVAIWLEERGIKAFVKNPLSLLAAPQGVGFEVCVDDASQAEEARALLRDHFDSVARQKDAAPADQSIQVKCEQCGRTSEFPAARCGSVQACSHCGASVEVPPN